MLSVGDRGIIIATVVIPLSKLKIYKENKMREKAGVILLFSIILEISIGGGGRFTAIGAVTLRMLLFLLSILYLFFKKPGKLVKKEYLALVFIFFLNLLFSTYIGLVNNASIDGILEDIKSFSYFFIFLFLSITIDSLSKVKNVVKIIMASSLIMSILYLLFYWGLDNKFINYLELYALTEESGEIVFRSESAFVYKGFLFPCIGVFMFLQQKNVWSKFAAFIMMISIYLTYTRGFLISIIVILISSLIIKSIYHKKFTFLAITSLLSMSFAPQFISTYLDSAGLKDESDTIRITTINEVFDKINFQSLFVGHGLGIGVPTRPIHMEISFLEIFHKQGFIGLFFWVTLFLIISNKFIKTCRIKQTRYSLPLYLSSVFIYIQSQTNPFLTNPIGICMLAVTMVSMDVIIEDNKTRFVEKGIVETKIQNF
jgi:hypothetical protein